MDRRVHAGLDRLDPRVRGRRMRRLAGRCVRAEAELGLRGLDAGLLPRARVRASGRAAAAAEALRGAIATTEDPPLHAARIAVKKWRYALECLSAAGDPGLEPRIRGLRAIQQALGDVHDLAVLRDRLRRRAGASPEAAAAWLAAAASLEADRLAKVEAFRPLARGELAEAAG